MRSVRSSNNLFQVLIDQFFLQVLKIGRRRVLGASVVRMEEGRRVGLGAGASLCDAVDQSGKNN